VKREQWERLKTLFNGALDQLLFRSKSLTADYLSGRKTIPVPKKRRRSSSSIKITGAREHNLRNVDVDVPLGVFTCVTGVSGSGKSTLIHDVLYRNLLVAKGQTTDHQPSQSYGSAGEAGACKSVSGAHRFNEVVMVDQSPLARTPRSTPILYLGLYDRVRELFAAQPEAMSQGLTASAFSFNSGSGRCERCSGTGFEKIEMQFLSDLYVRCAECEGKRFQPHVLKIKLHDKSIHDVLELTVHEAIQFFARIGERKTLSDSLDVLDEVGLGYLRLGQPLNTLSGGESQRLKLVRHLSGMEGHAPSCPKNGADSAAPSRTSEARGNLFIFDEPTTGLHFDDVAMLLQVFQRLVERGNSLIVVEHNLEVIKSADWIVDLGPEAGDDGGEVVGVLRQQRIEIMVIGARADALVADAVCIDFVGMGLVGPRMRMRARQREQGDGGAPPDHPPRPAISASSVLYTLRLPVPTMPPSGGGANATTYSLMCRQRS